MEACDILTMDQLIEEEKINLSLRPQSLDDFIGQDKMKFRLRTFVEAAKIKKQGLGHILFAGPPGLGKTSLASLIASEMGVEMHTTSGPTLKNPGDLAAILTMMRDDDVLFVDEIHRLPIKVQECLYSAMEDFEMDLTLGSGPSANIIRIRLPRFTLIGATTHTGKLEKPMMDRFVLSCRMEHYSKPDLKKIIVRASASMGLTVTDKAATGIARRSRGTPRIANNMLRRISDYAELLGEENHISSELAESVFEMEDIDSEGLEEVERRYLKTLIEDFECGPVGVINMSAKLGESTSTLEQIESYLIQLGFLVKMDRGRMATMKAVSHLGYGIGDYTKETTWLH